MASTKLRRAVILVVEDDPADQELISRALNDGRFRSDLRFVSNGEEALTYLRREGAYADPEAFPLPNLVLMDLNMPRMDGRELLEAIRADEHLKHLPVVVLTTSNQEEDVLRSYQLNCQSFVTKPVEPEEFIKALRGIGAYWFQLVTLPKKKK